MNNTKIAFICTSTGFGGLEMNLVRIASWLQYRGNKIFVACIKNTPLHQFALEKNLECHFLPLYNKYFSLNHSFKLARYLKSHHISHVFIRDKRDMAVIGMAKWFYSRFKLVYLQGMQIGIKKKDIFHTYRFSFIDAWICTLQGMKDEVMEKTRFSAHKIHVIPLGSKSRKITSNAKTKNVLREQFKINSNDIVLGIIGRLSKHKGQDFVIQLMPSLLQVNKNIKLLISGEPTKNEGNGYLLHLQKLVEDLNLQENVIFSGFLKDTLVFYQLIDCMLMASEKETFGAVTVEALLHGVPVIGTNSGGTPEILQRGALGYLYEPGNKESFVEAFHRFLVSAYPEGYNYDEIFNCYAHDKMCEKIEKLLLELK